jgi:hypothetical protein
MSQGRSIRFMGQVHHRYNVRRARLWSAGARDALFVFPLSRGSRSQRLPSTSPESLAALIHLVHHMCFIFKPLESKARPFAVYGDFDR